MSRCDYVASLEVAIIRKEDKHDHYAIMFWSTVHAFFSPSEAKGVHY